MVALKVHWELSQNGTLPILICLHNVLEYGNVAFADRDILNDFSQVFYVLPHLKSNVC